MRTYTTDLPLFDTLVEAETWLRSVYTPFGSAADAFWRRMARSSVRRVDAGRWTLHYDPAIMQQFSAAEDEFSSWDRYAKIATPTQVVQGVQSDILTGDILARMQLEGPRPAITQIGGCGHAPTLSRAEDISMVRRILSDLT